MATIVNTPSHSTEDTSGSGVVVGIVIALLVLVLFFVFGLPYLRNNQAPADTNSGTLDVNVSIPGTDGGTNNPGGTGGGTTNP